MSEREQIITLKITAVETTVANGAVTIRVHGLHGATQKVRVELPLSCYQAIELTGKLREAVWVQADRWERAAANILREGKKP